VSSKKNMELPKRAGEGPLPVELEQGKNHHFISQ
jgi:hypothetical protein